MTPESFAATASTDTLRLRVATLADVPTLEAWDRAPHVIAGVTDDATALTAFAEIDWREEIEASSAVSFYLIAETLHDGTPRPIGAMQIADPAREPTHYWGEVEPDLRVLDIWIGEADALNAGWGTKMMRGAIAACFAQPEVHAILIDPLASNVAAHRFYQRLGFVVEGRRLFHHEDDCLVHRLTRANFDSAVRIVRLGPEDVELAQATFALMAAVFDEAEGTTALGTDYVARLLARPDFWALAALQDGEVVGGLTAHALPMTRTESSELFIYDLAVHASRQRTGIGRALVEHLRREGADAGIHVAFVPADDEDTHALDFYRALGGDPAPVTIFTFE